MTRLLLVACSATKRHDEGLLPAVDRYDGPVWRTLRAAGVPADVAVYAVSAKLGVIPASRPIADYELQLRPEWTDLLRPRWRHQLRIIRHSHELAGALVVAGHAYLDVLDLDALECPVQVAAGGIGAKRAELRAWLDPPARQLTLV